jgi:putative chitinase
MPLNDAFLRTITPRYTTNRELADAQRKCIEAIGPMLQQTLTELGLNTDLRAVHFIAQACHETMGLALLEEQDSGVGYENRADLGNTQPGDGPRYKGRGIFQLTGRKNYKTYGDKLGLDLINHPGLAADPINSLRIACEFWNRNNLNTYADADDVLAISKIINTGHNGTTMPNGLQDRKDYLAKAKAALGSVNLSPSAPPQAAAPAAGMPPLRPNDKGPPVTILQEKLIAAGYTVAVDGDYGPNTEKMVRQFQRDHKLEEDAIVGAATWKALG